jgi:isopentenyl diphosphate isomerase/L-lactate dehydrogenase-like FMN-dependent dehydrogenase
MRVSMALTGCTRIAEIDGQILDRSANQATF